MIYRHLICWTEVIEVRVTWEHCDAERLVNEASRDGIQRIVTAGGDGTLNEVVSGLAKLDSDKRPELAIMPLGTANDFATACSSDSGDHEPVFAGGIRQTLPFAMGGVLA